MLAHYETAWKTVTIMIGGNNLCLVCDPAKERANDEVVYEANLRAAFDTLKQLPRTVISMVSNLDYTQLSRYSTST